MIKIRSFDELPKDPKTCVYGKWLRNGYPEDAGICIRGDRNAN